MDRFQPQSKWSELPSDLLIKIAKLMSTTPAITFSCKLQILQFRAVCKSWRCALPFHNKYCDPMVAHDVPLPISATLPSELHDLGQKLNGIYCLVPTTSYIFQSLKDPFSVHLLIVDHLNNEPGKVHCRNPLLVSHDRSSSWGVDASRSLNLLDYRVSIVAEEYSLRYLSKVDGEFQVPVCYENFCQKAVLFWNPTLQEEMDVVAIVLFDGGVLGQYSFREQGWEVIYDGKLTKCSDVIKLDDGCIVIDHKANAYAVQYNFSARSLTMVQFAPEITGGRMKRKRLVHNSDNGTLYLIVQHLLADRGSYGILNSDKKLLSFTTYEFCENQHIWVTCSEIPEFVLFVGTDFSFSAKAKALPGICSGHCIYSCKASFPPYQGDDDADLYFTEKMHPLCVFYIGCDRADAIAKYRYNSGYDCNPLFSSPSKWLELNQQPSASSPSQHSIEIYHAPLILSERDSVQVEGDQVSGGHPVFIEAENIGTGTTDTIPANDNSDVLKDEQDPKGKGKRTAVDANLPEPSNHSRSKLGKVSPSQSSVDPSESDDDDEEEEDESVDSFQKLAERLTKLISSSSTVDIQSDPHGCSIAEAIKDLNSLPNIEGDDDFYNSAVSLLLKKRNRELYMCFDDADLKYKWLRYLQGR